MQKTTEYSITFRGREVYNPFLRILLVLLLVIGWLIMIVLFVVTLPVMIVLHVILRVFGRRGFFTIGGGNYDASYNREAFRRR